MWNLFIHFGYFQYLFLIFIIYDQLTGNETNVGEGVIKEDAKGRGNNLTVKKGDKIVIIRTDNNPANKFLVKTDSKSE